jgi:hypothetical protein
VLLHGRVLLLGLTALRLCWRAAVSCQHKMQLQLRMVQLLQMQLRMVQLLQMQLLVPTQLAAGQLWQQQQQQQARWT